jgi:hypothetical protein
MSAMDSRAGGAASLVDLEAYPLLDFDSPRARAVVDQHARSIRETGAAELSGFLTADGLARCRADAESLVPQAHWSRGKSGPYLEIPEPGWPDGHPRRHLEPFSVGAIAYDLFPTESPLRQLYEWDPLMHWIGAILGRSPLHRYADPLGALNVAVMQDGDSLEWHFDQTDFVVSLALQDSESGGDFEVSPRIRNTDDERYDDVARVLGGDHRSVVTLPLTPGTLLVFAGRNSLHRVSEIRGATPRLIALLAYDEKPGTRSSELLQKVRYGRAA